jgi:iron complex outermembrane receptor protein
VGTGQGGAEALDPLGKFGSQKILFDMNYTSEQIIENWNIDAQLSYYRSTQEVEEDIYLFPAGTFFGAFPNGLIGNPGWEENNVRASLKGDYTRINNHHITLGSGFSRADLFQVTETKNFFADISPRPNGIEDVSDTAEVFLPELSRSSHFFYIQDIWQLAPDWELTAGLRYDDFSDFGSTVNPRLALVWSSSLDSSTKFLFGRAFRAPSIAELYTVNNPVALGNLNLAPEIIDTFEFGYSIRHGASQKTNINAFYYQIEDFITFVPDTDAPSTTAQNLGMREGYGLEIETGIYLAQQVSIKANYSYVKAKDKILDTDVGDYPNHQLKMILNWEVQQYWNLNISANVVGKRRRTPIDSRDSLGGYSDLAFNLRYVNSESGWQASISARNILDDNIYEPSIAPSTADGVSNIPFDLPQSGVSYFVNIAKTF